MLSYSVVFITKINLLSLRHRCLSGKFRIFLKKSYSNKYQWAAVPVWTLFLNSDNLLTGYEQVITDSIKIYYPVLFYIQKVDLC